MKLLVDAHDHAEPPHVSTVICTRNRPDKIGNAVESVLRNSYPNFDLTVVDQSTNGDTEALVSQVAERDARVHLIRDSGAGLSRAYNIAIASTTGDVLAFTDDDCIVPETWIASVVDAFTADAEADLLYGQVLAAPDPAGEESGGQTPILRFELPLRLSQRDGFRVIGMGANFAARRRLFTRVGMFDEVLGGGGPLRSSQDFDLAYRAFRTGSVIVLRPEVTLLHDGRRDVEAWSTVLRSYGFGDGAFYMKHVRCGDMYALRLLLAKIGRKGAKIVVSRARLRHPEETFYLRGVLAGIRGGLRYEIDRSTRQYRFSERRGQPAVG